MFEDKVMATDNLQTQRLELKYIVPERVALAVRDFASVHLMLDKFGEGQPDFSYPVHSLYLDSDQFTLYWHTINGNKNRYKLRLRYYDENPETPVFFEIKRRMNEAILKQRGGVKRSAVERLLMGQLPDPEDLHSTEHRQVAALENFCRLMQHHAAKPKAHIIYRREAWISPHNNSVRVTMDRDVQFDPDHTSAMRMKANNPITVFGKSVVLELKFTGRFPDWFRDLARNFGLWQCSAAKYADGLTLLTQSGRSMWSATTPETFETAGKLQSRMNFLDRMQERSELAIA
jgi:hypothetical protein